jgi:hypothetical protein
MVLVVAVCGDALRVPIVRVVPEKTPFASESWAVNVLPAANAPVVEKGTKKLPPVPAQTELDDKALIVIV